MKRIITPVSVEQLEQELTKNKFIRNSNYGSNEIYSVSYSDSPCILKEIGRLRELAFRNAGGGTGKELDLDEYDTMPGGYKQLIVWDPKRKEIVGGYRYLLCRDTHFDENGVPDLATSHLFNFSPKFIEHYMPYMIELGRSFVQPNFQATTSDRRGIFALDNLWDGLGALIILHPEIKYFFGKVTMYPDFNRKARDIMLFFLNKYFGDQEKLVSPIWPLKVETSEEELKNLFSADTYLENYKILSQVVRALGENIPPLINSYMNLSPTMKSFGTALNPIFGDVEETGILITIDDIYVGKKDRHISTFKQEE